LGEDFSFWRIPLRHDHDSVCKVPIFTASNLRGIQLDIIALALIALLPESSRLIGWLALRLVRLFATS
jgi:hypothetical protein